MVSIVIILTIKGDANYLFAGFLAGVDAFSGTGVPSTFLCVLIVLQICLPLASS